jgi:flagellar hook assembly protein FlgD
MYEGGEVGVPDNDSMAGAARLEIFDLRGRLVRVLVDEVLSAGRYEVMWDGTDSSGRAMASGVYLSRFEADGHVAQGRLSLVQ